MPFGVNLAFLSGSLICWKIRALVRLSGQRILQTHRIMEKIRHFLSIQPLALFPYPFQDAAGSLGGGLLKFVYADVGCASIWHGVAFDILSLLD